MLMQQTLVVDIFDVHKLTSWANFQISWVIYRILVYFTYLDAHEVDFVNLISMVYGFKISWE